MVIGHNALLWHEALLCETLARLADDTVPFNMPQFVGAAQSTGDLAQISATPAVEEYWQHKNLEDDDEWCSSFTSFCLETQVSY